MRATRIAAWPCRSTAVQASTGAPRLPLATSVGGNTAPTSMNGDAKSGYISLRGLYGIWLLASSQAGEPRVPEQNSQLLRGRCLLVKHYQLCSPLHRTLAAVTAHVIASLKEGGRPRSRSRPFHHTRFKRRSFSHAGSYGLDEPTELVLALSKGWV